MSSLQAAVARSQAVHPAVFGARASRAGLDERSGRRARANWPSRLIDAAGGINIGRVCDVSEGGFGVMSAVHLPVGALLDIALAVPRSGDNERSVPLRCKVRVVSCAFAGIESRLSVQFLELPKDSRIAIRNYVISHS